MTMPTKRTRIERLTPEQEAALAVAVEDWRAIGISCERADRPRAEAAWKAMYAEVTSSVATLVPDEVAWKVQPGDTTAHAFSAGPGWMRSVCREARWTVAIQDPSEDAVACWTCWELVEGALTESEQRLMDGNR
jgi:hypothetical protein